MIAYLLPVVAGLSMCLGYLLRKYEESETKPTVEKTSTKPVYTKEMAETETFLAVLHDDTLDDIKLKQYRPIKVRNRAPLAIEARPHTTTASMQRIRAFMLDHGVTRKMPMLAIEAPKTETVGKHRKED